jgi:hypothetical protein
MNTTKSNRHYYNPEMDIYLSISIFYTSYRLIYVIFRYLSMNTAKSKLSIIMAIYIRMYLSQVIYNLSFVILIVIEMYGRNRRSIREP